MMKVDDFLDRIRQAARSKTLYVSGCFGAPMTPANKQRYSNNNDYNRQPSRKAKIMAADADTFGFDCVCLIKGVLWGWTGDPNKQYGGAAYTANGVPDIGADQIIYKCPAVRKDWTNLVPGALLYKPGHVGIYIGNGEAVECTPIWEDRVQISNVANLGYTSGHSRTWTAWGLLPYVDYTRREMPFVDVPETAWYYNAVRWAYDHNIISGTDATHFSPNAPITRAQLIQILWRLHNNE